MKNHVNVFSAPCSGCGACVLACPQGAVLVKLDEEGLYTATVDEKLCVNCGICKTVCMRSGTNSGVSLKNGIVVAAQSTDDYTVKKCTSGGIAYELSKYAYENEIGVLGVVYNYETNRAETCVAKTKEDLERFRGSKYIQSYTVEAFSEMITDMRNNQTRKYLVFGTPCQIFGLASLLEKYHMRDRVLLVDFFCHGVPSYKVWDQYLLMLKSHLGTNRLTEVTFRDKSIGWHNFVIRVQSNKGVYKEASEGDLFYHAFFDNVLFSAACFDCPVRKEVSKADLRLGDYWGKRYQTHEDGVSAILLCTKQGKLFFEQIKDKLTFFEAGSVDEVLKSQSTQVYSTEKYRKSAFGDLEKGKTLQETIKSYRKCFPVKKRMKLFIKESTAKLPDDVRAMIRKIYKKL